MAVPPPPPDPPTQRIRPTAPPPVVEERVVSSPAVDPNVILLRVEDAIEALRTWLVVVGVVALAALGVALYALLTDDEGDGRGTTSQTGLASDERVSQLENRIDRISRQVQDLRADASSSDSADVDSRVAALEKSVESLSGDGGDDATQAVEQLSGRVDEIAKDVEELKSSQQTP